MDAQNPLHYQAQSLHRVMSEQIAQHFAMALLLALVAAHLYSGSKFGVVFAMLGMLGGYTTWRAAVEGFSIGVITVSSLTGIGCGLISFIAYTLS